MTNDRDNTTADPSVSATYRQLADERTPAGLDEKVLHRAAAAPRISSGIGRAWMKPVAWAATLGLSLAIVLEMTQLPQAPLDIDVVAPPVPTDERPALAPASVEPAAAKESRNTKPSRHRSESGVIEESKAQPMVPVPAKAPAKAIAPEPVLLQDLESTDLQPPEDDDMTPDARSDEVAGTAAFAIRTERMLQKQPPALLCPETVREVAEDWYQCIEVQKNRVPSTRIAEELEEFRKKFPNFQVPGTE